MFLQIGALKNLNDKVWSHISAMRYEIAIMIILENNRDYKVYILIVLTLYHTISTFNDP